MYERLKETMKPVKGTKARKPKPHSLRGKRAAVAKAARRPTPATRGEHSRAEVKRKVAAKAAAEASAAARLGWREMLVECSPDDSPRAVIARLAPGFDVSPMRAAVDSEYFQWDDAIGPVAKELAILPPVSGG